MSATPNIGLTKPALSTDPVKPDKWGATVNENFDLVDSAIAADRTILDSHDTEITDLLARVAALEGGGGGGGHTILINGVPVPQRSKINFTGSVTVTDDAANDQTIVEILGDGGEVDGTIYMGGEPIYFAGEPLVVGG